MTVLGVGFKMVFRTRTRSAVATLALASTLAPLLVIWGIKAGYVDTLITLLRTDPRNLEIRLRGDKAISEDEIAAIRALPGAGYVEPTSRGLSVRIFVSSTSRPRREAASLLPSGLGDPLLAGSRAPAPQESYISRDLADELSVAAGDRIVVANSRAGNADRYAAPLDILGVLPATRLTGKRLLVHPSIVWEVEDFIEGYAVPARDLAGNAPRQHTASNARIYAKDLEDVASLTTQLQALGYYAVAENASVESALSLQHSARFLSRLLGAALLVGATLTLWGTLTLNLLPQRRHVALLRLMGATRLEIAAYVVVQGALLGTLGTGLGILISLGLRSWVNHTFASLALAGRPLCMLTSIDLLAAFLAAFFLFGTVSIVFASLYWSLTPAGALRDES